MKLTIAAVLGMACAAGANRLEWQCPFDASQLGCTTSFLFPPLTGAKYPGCLNVMCGQSCAVWTVPGCTSKGKLVDCGDTSRFEEYRVTAQSVCTEQDSKRPNFDLGKVTHLQCQQQPDYQKDGAAYDVEIPIVVPDPPVDYEKLCHQECSGTQWTGCAAYNCGGDIAASGDPNFKFKAKGCGYSVFCFDDNAVGGGVKGCEVFQHKQTELDFYKVAEGQVCQSAVELNIHQCYDRVANPDAEATKDQWIVPPTIPKNHTDPEGGNTHTPNPDCVYTDLTKCETITNRTDHGEKCEGDGCDLSGVSSLGPASALLGAITLVAAFRQ